MKMAVRALLILTILVTPLAAWWFAFVPENQYIEAMTKDVEHKKMMLEKLRAETTKNADIHRTNEELRKSVAMIEQRLPSNKEVDAIVRQVSELAISSGLGAPGIKSSKPFKSALYMEQPLEMDVIGDFAGFFNFILEVEKLPRITRIHDLKIQSLLKGDAELRAQFTLSIYFQDDSTSVASGAKP